MTKARLWRSCIPSLRRAIDDSGLSMKQISIKSGVGETTIYSWLSGSSSPTVDNLASVCAAIGASVSGVVSGGERRGLR